MAAILFRLSIIFIKLHEAQNGHHCVDRVGGQALRWNPQCDGIYCLEGPGEFSIQSTAVRLVVNGGTTFVYFGITKDKNKIFKKFHVGLMGSVAQLLIKLEMSSIWGFLQFFLCCPLAITYANMLVATLWPLRHAPHLQSCVWYRVLEAPWSHLRYAKIFCIRYLDAFLWGRSFAFWFQFLRFFF